MRSVSLSSLIAAPFVALVLGAGAAGAQLPVTKPRPDVSPRAPVRDSIQVRPRGDSTGAVTPPGTSGTTGGRPGGATPGGATASTNRRADPKRGRYRVTLNGFTVYRQTYDNPLQIDGKGDEVYFAAYVSRLDTSSADLIDQQLLATKVHGDVNGFPERKQAGMASGRGGIQTGNTFPFPTPFKRTGAPSVEEIPMLLWEGELVQGQSAVVITPTVWEWDDNPELFAYWGIGRGAFAEQLLEPDVLRSILENRFWLPVEFGSPGLYIHTNMFADARDRPIGLDRGRRTNEKFAEPVIATGGGSKGAVAADNQNLISHTIAMILGTADAIGRRYETIASRLFGFHASSARSGANSLELKLPPPSNTGSAKIHLTEAVGNTGRALQLPSLAQRVASVVRDYSATDVYFFEKVIVVTPESVEAALLSSNRAGGRPAGIIDVPYTDIGPLAGRYVLHIQVERLP